MAGITFPQERQKFGFRGETTWGTADTAGAFRLLPVESPDIRLMPGREEDNNPRGIWAETHDSYRTTRHAEASLRGFYYPYLVDRFLWAIFGDDDSTSQLEIDGAAATFQKHVAPAANSTITGSLTAGSATVKGFSFQIEDDGGDSSAYAVRGVGMVPTRIKLNFNAAEGMMMWEGDFMGADVSFNGAIGSTAIAGGTIGKFSSGTISLPTAPIRGWAADFVAWSEAAADVTSMTGRVLEAEITIDRRLELVYRGSNTAIPSAYLWKSPRITFNGTFELTDYDDIERYTNFEANRDSWRFAFFHASDPGVIVAGTRGAAGSLRIPAQADIFAADTGFEDDTTAFNSPINNTNFEADDERYALVLDIKKVDFGESAVTRESTTSPVRITVNGLALPDSSNNLIDLRLYDARDHGINSSVADNE